MDSHAQQPTCDSHGPAIAMSDERGPCESHVGCWQGAFFVDEKEGSTWTPGVSHV